MRTKIPTLSHSRMLSPQMPMRPPRLVGPSRPTAHSSRPPRLHLQNVPCPSLVFRSHHLHLVTVMASPLPVPAVLRRPRHPPHLSRPAHPATVSCLPVDFLGVPHHTACFRQEVPALEAMRHLRHHARHQGVSRPSTTWHANCLHGARVRLRVLLSVARTSVRGCGHF